ncbi:flagellin [Heyndrickxia sp. NPDC080065]|uniref:flagellin N-terminal helical domain-containing protein n=1 Tax=Heyndrickxia sp. NPDC080065 TaxID=3390568 RepID=UPI003D07AF53
MRINNNIQALNAYRNLNQTMGSTSKSLEKLSSGLRINRAADDAAGLAISEKMRSQIRGLDMAERNSLDAVSLIQTGEGALNEVHSILQRMRELSVQAANGTLETQDQEAIQSEIDQLTYEVDRIADTTQFNQKKLFRGSEQGRAFADVSSNQVSYAGDGTWQGVVTADPTKPASVELDFSIDVGKLTSNEIDGMTFVINGKTYEIDTTGAKKGIQENGNIAVNVNWINTKNDDNAVNNINELMDKLASAINKNDETFDQSKIIKASNNDNKNDGVIEIGKLTLVTSKNMSPADADKIGVSSNVTGLTIIDPATSNPIDHIVGSDEATAKSITLPFSKIPQDGDQIQIDGLIIKFGTTPGGYTGGSNAIIDITDKDVFSILKEIDDILTTASNDPTQPVPALTSHKVVGNTLVLATNKTDDGKGFNSGTNGLEIAITDNNFKNNQDKELSIEFQIGANSGETLKVSLGIMDAASLGIGCDEKGNPITTPGVKAAKGVDVTTADGASAAITIFDKAIQKVSEQRSKLGAIQNRLEHTVSNLQNANENLTSAESRIRDLDMAKEMTNFTKNNILNQAGQAMLAQANQLPQGILQLLK